MNRWILFSVAIFGAMAALYLLPISWEQNEQQYDPDKGQLINQTSWRGAEQNYRSIRGDVSTGLVSREMLAKTERQVQQFRRRGTPILNLELEPLGPDNLGGRTRAILVDRNNNQRVYAGSVSGGLYVSNDAAGIWEPVMAFMNTTRTSSIISSLAQAPNGDLYVGTGCSFEINNGVIWPGRGIAVSRDGGESFDWITRHLIEDGNARSEGWNAINRLAFNPNTSRLYACTHEGLHYKEDDSDDWINPIDLAPNFPNVGIAHDIVIADDGTVITAVGGRVYRSESGDAGTYEEVTGNGFLSELYVQGRVVLAMSPSNNDYVYAATVENISGDNVLEAVYRSTDKGRTWSVLRQRTPVSFDPMGTQGRYNLALAVDPINPEKIFLGGIELWVYDELFVRHTSESFGLFHPKYVHADKHIFYFDPTDPRVMYIGSDGGVSKSIDRGETFVVANKGFMTSQFYSVAFSPKQSVVLGGTQDNGTNVVTGLNDFDPLYGFELFIHDGFDCEASQYFPTLFASSQFSLLVRIEASNSEEGGPFPTNEISVPYSNGDLSPGNGGPFHTVVRLWENVDDPTSKDEVVFAAGRESQPISRRNDLQTEFSAIVHGTQVASIPVEKSIRIFGGSKELCSNEVDNGVLTGEFAEGTVNYLADGSLELTFKLNELLSEGLRISAEFDVRYEAGAELELQSSTEHYPFAHVLQSDLQPGETISVRDPVQSLLAFSVLTTDENGNPGLGLAMTRDGLKLQDNAVNWIEFDNLGQVTCAEFSADGNHLYVGIGNSFIGTFSPSPTGRVLRISGLNELYSEEDLDQVEITEIFVSDQTVTGIALDYNDADRLLVTLGNYGQPDYVHYTEDALSADPTFRSVQGNLPTMPVYDAEFDINDPNIVILGTDVGIWATDNISSTAGDVEWGDENQGSGGLTYLPIFDVRQQKLGFGGADNYYEYYFATHGRGLWKTGTLQVLSDDSDLPSDPSKASELGLNVYPNPMTETGTLAIETARSMEASLLISDLSGRVVRQEQLQLQEGENNLPIASADLNQGTYLLVLRTEESSTSTRFVVTR